MTILDFRVQGHHNHPPPPPSILQQNVCTYICVNVHTLR